MSANETVMKRRRAGNERAPTTRYPILLSLPDVLVNTVEALAEVMDNDRNAVLRGMLRDSVESALLRLTPETRAMVAKRAAELALVPRGRGSPGSNMRRKMGVPRREKGAPLTVAAVGEALAETQRRVDAQDWAGATHARATVASAPPSPVDDRGTGT